MAKRHKEKAKKLRVLLLDILEPVCVACGETDVKKLTFDCIESRGDKHHKGSTDQRMTFYMREHNKGNIQVLCHFCQSRKGAKENSVFLAMIGKTNQPF